MHTESAEHSGHSPNLAHHFDTPNQQFESGKLGMWLFCGTELLMFGGLFCAYTILRANHPEVFHYGHQFLDKKLGAINTLVLICSSFTMANGVRAAQTGRRLQLIVMLALTLACAFGFLGIKYVEYSAKFHHGLLWGKHYTHQDEGHGEKPGSTEMPGEKTGSAAVPVTAAATGSTASGSTATGSAATGSAATGSATTGTSAAVPATPVTSAATNTAAAPAGKKTAVGATSAAAKPAGKAIVATGTSPIPEKTVLPSAADTPDGMAVPSKVVPHELPAPPNPQLFFGIYFAMTGLHGIHVIAGIGVITWLLIGAMKGRYGPDYFTPVDLVGLYWHIVDMIWIFLFPLFYLIG